MCYIFDEVFCGWFVCFLILTGLHGDSLKHELSDKQKKICYICFVVLKLGDDVILDCVSGPYLTENINALTKDDCHIYHGALKKN